MATNNKTKTYVAPGTTNLPKINFNMVSPKPVQPPTPVAQSTPIKPVAQSTPIKPVAQSTPTSKGASGVTGTTPIVSFISPTPNTGSNSGSYDLTPKDEDKIRRDTLQRYQGQIDATKAVYSRLLGDTQLQGTGRLGESTAMQARGGLMGSDFGAAMTDKTRAYNLGQEQNVLQSQAAAIAGIMAQAEGDSRSDIAARREANRYGYEAKKQYNAEEQTRKTENVKKLALSMVRQGVDPKTMGEQLKQLAKTYKVSENDIINSYFEEKEINDAAQFEAEQEGAFNLSKGQSRYDRAGNLIASRAETFAPSSGGGSFKQEGALVTPAAQNILNLMNRNGGTVNDYVTGSSREAQNLRNQVYAALAGQGGATDITKDLAVQAKAVIDSMVANNDHKQFGYSSRFGGQFTQSYGDMSQRAAQISAILAKDNLGLLKGAMSDKDLAFIQAMSGGVSTQGTISEAFAKERIESIQKKFEDKVMEYEMTPQVGSVEGGDEVDDFLNQF